MKSSVEHSSDELDLKIFYLPLLRYWKFIGVGAFICTLIAAGYSLTLDKYYEARAVIMSGVSSSSGGLLSELKGGVPLMGILGVGGGDQVLQRYERILKSRSFVRDMLNEHGLYEVLQEGASRLQGMPDEEKRERIVRNMVGGTIVANSPPVLEIAFQSTRPEVAFKVVDAYLKSLRNFVNSNTLTQAKSTEMFIKERLEDAQTKLSEVEEKYTELQSKTGTYYLPVQSGQALGAAANLEAQLIEKEIEIAMMKDVMRSSGEIKRLESERDQIQRQLDKLIHGKSANRTSSDASGKKLFTPLKDIPSLEMEFASARRDYLIQGRLVELLQKQLEIAQIETKKSDPIFQVVDAPVVPVLPAGPSRRLITLVGMMLGLFLCSLGAIIYYHLPARASEQLGRISAPILTIVSRRKDLRKRSMAD